MGRTCFPNWPTSRSTTGPAARPRPGTARTGIPRSTAPICRRWCRDGRHPGRDPGALLDVPRQADTTIIRTIKDDLDGWQLRRLVWVADRGFVSAANRTNLTRGGGHYIQAEKLRHTNTEAAAALARAGRYHTVAGNLRVKEVHVNPREPHSTGTGEIGDDDSDAAVGMRAVWLVVCHNPEGAIRDAAVRDNLVGYLQQLIAGSDSWTPARRDQLVGSLKTKPGVRRYLPAPAPACSGSTTPRSNASPTWTASGCCAARTPP
jgi:hypothetical protein